MSQLAGCLIAMVLSSGLVACGGDSGEIEEFVKLDTAMGEAFAAGGDDCLAKARSVREWRTQHHAAYRSVKDKLKERYKDGPPKAAVEKYGEQLKKNKQATMDATIQCAKSPEFVAAMKETQ